MSLPCTLHHLLEKGISVQIFSYRSFHKVKSAGFVALSDLAIWMWKLQQEHMERPLRLGYLDLKITARTPGECFAYSLLAI
jgi:hypothetical protein